MTRTRNPSAAALGLTLVFCLTGCSGRGPSEFATYRLAGHLVPEFPSNCGECVLGLVLDGTPVDGGGGAEHRRFYLDLASSDFHFRWGVEQVVEIESWNEAVPAGLMDDTGLRERMVRVVSEHPIVAGTRFTLPFRSGGDWSINVEREGNAVRLRDHWSSVLLRCSDPAVCDTIAAMELGHQEFRVDLEYTAEDGVVLAQGVTLGL
ncbi:MAG TPA: hypothetical protein VGK67_28150 [Myxococcales bacterium]|jgi:hypothetical protein